MKKVLSIILVLSLLTTGCVKSVAVNSAQNEEVEPVSTETEIQSDSKVTIIDDNGKEITLDAPAKSIISLYSVHTENLYSLGLDQEIIGVSTSDQYPEAVLSKIQYSAKDDPELVIAAKPDLVLARTMLVNTYPDYFNALEKAGIPVVNLYCDRFDQFDHYIERLAILVGKQDEGEIMLQTFEAQIEAIKEKSQRVSTGKRVYFESIGAKFKTATPTSFAGTALTLLGLDNVASDVETDGSTTVVAYGEEALLAKANDIDIYIAQKGTMNKTVSLEEITARPGYLSIKAVKEGNVFIIDEKLISSATMRYIEGLGTLSEEIYGVK